ncbi:MAG: hypothetical protein EB127_29075, partial [Alphaproteobacteria bacterium]|nr:hypothetical protein [Alphaproteobacteria bacterium]
MTSNIKYSKEKAWFEKVIRILNEIENQLNKFQSAVKALSFNVRDDTSLLDSLFVAHDDPQSTIDNFICPLFCDIFRFWTQLREGRLSSDDYI